MVKMRDGWHHQIRGCGLAPHDHVGGDAEMAGTEPWRYGLMEEDVGSPGHRLWGLGSGDVRANLADPNHHTRRCKQGSSPERRPSC
jgi:hypothetical protein